MKKVRTKKAIVTTFMMILTVTMIGCGKRDGQESNVKEMMYEGTEFEIAGMDGKPDMFCVKDDKLYILSSRITGETKEFQFCKAGLDGNNLSTIVEKLPEDESVVAFLVNKDGGITYMASHAGEHEETNLELVKLDSEGNELQREDTIKFQSVESGGLLNNVAEDANGNVILADAQRLYILDENFQPIGEVEAEKECQVIDFARTKDGEIVCVESEEKMAHIESKVCMLDVEKCKWGTTLKLENEFNINNDCVTDGAEYDFYYKGDGIYGYDMDAKKGTKLLDASVSYLTRKDVSGLVSSGDGRFIGITYDYSEQEEASAFEVYAKTASVDDKQVITYGVNIVSDTLMRAVREFNEENKDYRIEFIKYDNNEDYTRMRADIVAGKVPDIIDISYLGLSVEQCVAKGLLEDLTPYYEEDSEVGVEDVIPSVLEGMKIDGRLYYLAPYFSVNTVAGKRRDVGNGTGWTFDDIKELLEERGDNVLPFGDYGKTNILVCFLCNGLMDFVDWNTGECSFNSSDFKDILELCNRGREDSEDEYIGDQNSGIREGKILLKAYYSGISLENIQADKQIFGKDVTYIGYPNKEKQGSYFNFVNMVGIYSKSDVKDKAWEFLRFFMTKEYQAKIVMPRYFAMPTRQDCFDLRVKALMATEAYTDEYGQEIEPLEKRGYMGIEYGPISQEDVDTYVDLINHTKKRATLDEEMMEIVLEEAQAYFEGDKGLDETAEIIQDRIQTYVNENR